VADGTNEGDAIMAKSQKRSSKEIRKPKAEKPKSLPKLGENPVMELMKKPKSER
jgi:hypothetical protein